MYFNGIRPSRQGSCPFLRYVILCFRVGICSSQSGVIFYVLIPSQSHFLPCAVTMNNSCCTLVCMYYTYRISPLTFCHPGSPFQSLHLIHQPLLTRSQIFACLLACSCLFIAFVLRVYNLVSTSSSSSHTPSSGFALLRFWLLSSSSSTYFVSSMLLTSVPHFQCFIPVFPVAS